MNDKTKFYSDEIAEIVNSLFSAVKVGNENGNPLKNADNKL